MDKIGIIGFGNMGEAVCAGLLRQNPDLIINVCSRSVSREEKAGEMYGVKLLRSPEKLVKQSDIIIIAVKPQDSVPLLEKIRNVSKNKKFISVMAGKKTAFLKNYLDTDEICRFMPNLAAFSSSSLTAVSPYEKASRIFTDEALKIAGAIGESLIMPEKLIPAETAMSGSGIAFVFQFIHAMSLAGVRCGIPYRKGVDIMLQTLTGAVDTLKSAGKSPSDLITSVTSPGGLTIEGITALEKNNFNYSVMAAVHETYLKAIDMEE